MRSSTLETVEILDLRHYGAADLRPLLERESEVWARALAWDYRSSADMILRYIDAKVLPGYIVLEQGRVAGYSFFVYEGSKGVIGDLFSSNADPAAEAALNQRLLRHVIETLQQSPGIHRIECQLLAHESGAAAGPFQEEGFRVFKRQFMELPLSGSDTAASVLPPDVELRPWAEGDFQPASQLIYHAYSGHIDSEINDQYRTVAGSLRFLNNIVRFPGCGVFDAGSSFVAVSRATGAMIGLLLCSRVREDVGHVTQVCLLPEQRGRRLGESLIAACSRELHRRHFSLLTLTVSEANARAVDLYRRLGFTTRRVFDAFVWEG